MPFFIESHYFSGVSMMLDKFPLALATFKGGLRDRLLLGLFVAALLLLGTMPLFSSFSMRDVTGVAITYSISGVSAIGVLLVVFIGGALIPRDIQSRTIYSIATLPVSRTRYLLEKYLGLALILLCSMMILGFLSLGGNWLMAVNYPPDRPIQWGNYLLYLFFDFEKLLVVNVLNREKPVDSLLDKVVGALILAALNLRVDSLAQVPG